MLGNVVTMISAITLNATFQGASVPPSTGFATTPDILTIKMVSGDVSRTVSNDMVDRFPFAERYFINDVNMPFVITVSTVNNPMIPATRIPLYKIAALLDGGASVESVNEDYPSLTSDQINYARTYAKANPYLGRPYARTSFKRALRSMDFDKYIES